MAANLNGRVLSAGNNISLPGALIKIEELGIRTRSRQDGSFNLSGLPAGTYELTVEYLGYQMASQTVTVSETEGTSVSILLAQVGGELDELVVQGVRLSQSLALNEQRTSMNVSNVVSADAIGKFPDNNIAESVSRLPGITLVRDQQTGEGSLVTIRGLDSGLNSYTLNGVRMATAGGGDRAISLNQLPPDGLQSVKVSKTLTPDMDGDAIGGTVDFRTPSAFDFQEMTMGASVRYSLNDIDDDSGYFLNGHFGDTFGPDKNIGFYITGYYEGKDSTGEESENEGDWEPYAWKRDSTVAIDPETFMLQGVGLDLYRNDIERYGFNSTLDYRFDDGSKVYLRGQYSSYTDTENHTYFDVRNEQAPNRLLQADIDQADLRQPGSAIVGRDARGNIYDYVPGLEIVDSDGDGVITDAVAVASFENGGTDRLYSLIGSSGVWDPQALRVGRGFSTDDNKARLASVNLGGEHFIDTFTLQWDLAYSYGESRNTSYDMEFGRRNEAPFDSSGVLFSYPDPRYPQWLLPGNLEEAMYDPANLDFRGASGEASKVTDRALIGKVDLQYDFGHEAGLQWVKGGVKYRRSQRKTDESDLFGGDAADTTLADHLDLLASEDYGSFLSGFYEGVDSFGPEFARAPFLDAVGSCDQSLFDGECSGFDDLMVDDTRYREEIYAGYGMAMARWGKLEVFGGGRIEHTAVHNEFFEVIDNQQTDEETVEEATTNTSYTNVLPSIHFNYRQSDQLVYRGAVWTSIARPEFQYLVSRADVEVAPDGDVSISRGNPDLKPAEAVNVDLGAEYYSKNGGLVSLNFFYKDIDNFIFKNNAVSASVSDEGAEVSTVLNGQGASLYGVEVGLVQQFTTLPAPWDGLGFLFNYTYQRSRAKSGIDYRIDEKIPFINAPENNFNVQLFYEKYGLEARLAYNYTDKYIEDLRSNAVDKWIRPWDRLDFQLRYTLLNGVSVTAEVQNILDGHNYWSTRGPSNGYQKDYVENGRTFFLGLSWRR